MKRKLFFKITRSQTINTICISVLFLLQSFASFSQEINSQSVSHYYPQEFVKRVMSHSLNINTKVKLSAEDEKELVEEISDILEKVHVVREGQSDELAETCPSKATCYEQEPASSYEEARKYLFGLIDLVQTNKGYQIKDVYCQKTFTSKDGVGPMKIPNGNKLNCEHTWPQSQFSDEYPTLMQKVDLHHLFATDTRSNSSRNNLIFSEVDGQPVNETCTKSHRGESLLDRQLSFEPPNEHKGNVARAIFYFSERYNMAIDETEEHYLRLWHEQDPVDEAEKKRNDLIYSIQKNRNPFIDFPQLVDLIYDFRRR